MRVVTTESVSLCGVLAECNSYESHQKTPPTHSRVWESSEIGSHSRLPNTVAAIISSTAFVLISVVTYTTYSVSHCRRTVLFN